MEGTKAKKGPAAGSRRASLEPDAGKGGDGEAPACCKLRGGRRVPLDCENFRGERQLRPRCAGSSSIWESASFGAGRRLRSSSRAEGSSRRRSRARRSRVSSSRNFCLHSLGGSRGRAALKPLAVAARISTRRQSSGIARAGTVPSRTLAGKKSLEESSSPVDTPRPRF